MARKSIALSEREQRQLARVARAAGISESELIRRGVEIALHEPTPELDETAWKRELRFIKGRVGVRAMTKGRAWSREELYDERLSRISR